MDFKIRRQCYSLDDPGFFSKQLKESLEQCFEQTTPRTIYKIYHSINVISFLCEIPGLVQETLRKTGMDQTISIETLSMKAKSWPDIENKQQLIESISRFFYSILSVGDIKTEITRTKVEAHACEQFEPLSLLTFIAESLANQENDEYISLMAIKAFKLLLRFYESLKREEISNNQQQQKKFQRVPDFVQWKKPKLLEDSMQEWSLVIDALLLGLRKYEHNEDLQIKILDILIYLVPLSDRIKSEIVQHGAIRAMLSKINEDDVTLNIGRRCLIILRDICKNDKKTSELVSRHEAENLMLKILSKFRNEQEISDLISSILESLISGCDLDLENFEQNIQATSDRLSKYVQSDEKQADVQKALYNLEVIRFYSLMSTFTRKLVSIQIHYLLFQIIKKELEIDKKELDDPELIQYHERVLASTLLVLNRILQLPETVATKKEENVPKKLVVEMIPNLIKIIKWKSDMREVVQHTLECFEIFIQNEQTKSDTIKLAVKANVTEDLMKLSDVYKDDIAITKMINKLFFSFAKSSDEAAFKLSENRIVTNILQKIRSKEQDKDVRKRNLEYLSTLADIPKTADKIVEQDGIKFLQAYIEEENIQEKTKQKSAHNSPQKQQIMQSQDEDNIDEMIYDLDLAIQQDDDQNDDISQLKQNSNSQSLTMESNSVEILRKLLRNSELVEKNINEKLIKELLLFLRLYAKNKNLAISALRVINSCVNDDNILLVLQNNKAIESVFIALNFHPTDTDILELSGNILLHLNAIQLADDVKVQYPELATDFKEQTQVDQDTLESIRQANIYLSNLLTALPDEETQEMIQLNADVIAALEIFFQYSDMPIQVLASILLLVCRLCNQGEETKKLIRHSQIPVKIVQQIILNRQIMETTIAGRINEFAIDALLSMIGGGEPLLPVLDPQSGAEIIQDSREYEEEQLQNLDPLDKVFCTYCSPQYLQNKQYMSVQQPSQLQQQSMEALENILALLNAKSSNRSTIEKASNLLGRICDSNRPLALRLIRRKLDMRLLQVFQDYCQEERNNAVKQLAFTKLGRVLGVVGSLSSEVFNKICTEKILTYVCETLLNIRCANNDLINNLAHLDTLRSVMIFLRNLLKNTFDKSVLVNMNVPLAVIKVVSRVSELSAEDFSTSSYLSIVYRESLYTLAQMLQDPILFYDLSKLDISCLLVKYVQKFYPDNNVSEDQQLQMIDPNIKQPDDCNEIYGDSQTFNRTLEAVISCLELLSKQIKFASHLAKVYDSDIMHLVFVLCTQYNGPFIITKLMQSYLGIMIAYDEDVLSDKNLNLNSLTSNQLGGNDQMIGSGGCQLQPILDNKKFNNDVKLLEKFAAQKYLQLPIVDTLFKKIQMANQLLVKNDKKSILDWRNKYFNLIKEQKNLDQDMQELTQKAKIYKFRIEEQKQKQDLEQKVIESGPQQINNNPQTTKTTNDGNDLDDDQQAFVNDDDEHLKPNDDLNMDNESDMIKILNKIFNSLENVPTDIANAQFDKQRQAFILKMLETVRTFVVDDKTALKVHNIGITEVLIELILVFDRVDTIMASEVALTLSTITKFSRALKQSEEVLEFFDPLRFFFSFVLEQQKYEETEDKTLATYAEIQAQQKNKSKVPALQLPASSATLKKYSQATKYMLDLIKNICAFEANIEKFVVEQGGLERIIGVFRLSKDNVDLLVACAEVLDKLAYNDTIALKSAAEGILDLIKEVYPKYQQSLEFLRAFALLFGTVCRSQVAQEKLGQMQFHFQVIQGMKTFPTDIALATNSFYALSGLAYNSKENCQMIMQTDVLTVSKRIIKDFISEYQVIETVCSLYSNLTFKNEINKKKLGELGIMDLLQKMFAIYSCQKTLNAKVLKQILRALGNSSLIIENTTRIIKNSFVSTAFQLIEKMKYVEEGDVMRYCLDVISNLASHADEQNRTNTENMLKDGVIDLILNIMKKNQLNSELIASAIDALDGLIQNKLVSVVVAEKDTIELIIKIMKNQDWNEVVILKCSRVLANIALLKQNIDQLLKYNVPITLGDIIKNQKKPNDKMISYSFKVLNRIAQEKTKEKVMIHSGVIEAIGEGLIHRGINTDNVFNFISLLRSISKIPESIEIISKKSVGQAIQRALEYKQNQEIMKTTLVLIERLLIQPQSAEQIMQNNGLDLILIILKQSQQTSEILKAQSYLENLEYAFKCIKMICNAGEEFRKQCVNQKCEQSIQQIVKLLKDGSVKQHANAALFSLVNQKTDSQLTKQPYLERSLSQSGQQVTLSKEYIAFLVDGVDGKLYRFDGSFKKGVVAITSDMKQIVGKRKGEMVKDKYRININEISDYKFNYSQTGKPWEMSSFSKAGGMFTKKPIAINCISIYGPIGDQQQIAINFEFNDSQTKEKFEKLFLLLLDSQKK